MRATPYMMVALMLLFVAGASQGEMEELEGATTFIFGRVTDSGTGAPIEGVSVRVSNATYSRLFYAETDEEGLYEVQVGGPGNYSIEADSPLHSLKMENVEVEFFEWKEVDLSLYRYQHDLYFKVCDNNCDHPLEDARIVISENGETKLVLDTDEEGRAAGDIEPGNYTYTVERKYFQTVSGEMDMTGDEVEQVLVQMDLRRAGENSNITLEDNSFDVPPRSMVAYSFNSSFNTRAWMEFQSDVEVKMMEMTDVMYIYYRAEVTGENLSDHQKPPMESDLSLGPAYGGGGDIEVWSDTYHIVFVNEGDETSSVELLIKYDYGELEPAGYEVVALGPRDEERADDDGGREGIPWLIIVVVGMSFVLLLFTYSLLRKKPSKE